MKSKLVKVAGEIATRCLTVAEQIAPVSPKFVCCLHTQISKGQPEQVTVATPRVSRRLIVALPGEADRQTIIIIRYTQSMANGRKTIGR